MKILVKMILLLFDRFFLCILDITSLSLEKYNISIALLWEEDFR